LQNVFLCVEERCCYQISVYNLWKDASMSSDGQEILKDI